MTEPFFEPSRRLSSRDTVRLYRRASEVDSIEGAYPPDDTGSSGLAVMKAAREFGYVKRYTHAFGLNHALETLAYAPVITGVNWYEGFDRPDSSGRVKLTGAVTGGHEFEVVGLDVDRQVVRACNSWGPDWGDSGYFEFSFAAWDRLLHEDGDVTTAA